SVQNRAQMTMSEPPDQVTANSNGAPPVTDSGHSPTRARYITVFWLCSMAGVLYLDRVGWSQAAPQIQNQFELTNLQMSFLHMAFTIAYALFEVPTGHMGDSLGARSIMTRIAIWWSVFTALTGAGFGFYSILIIRFLFGAGEAGAYPNAARIYTNWFPRHERGRFQGLMLAVALLGGAFSPKLAAILIDMIGWRLTFVVFGLIGIVWAAGFWKWFRDDPANHPSVNEAELKYIRDGGGGSGSAERPKVPWGLVFGNSGFYILSYLIFVSSFNAYFYFSWFTKYLQAAHGLDNQQSGTLTSMALFGGAMGMLLGGTIADRIAKAKGSPVMRRRIFCASAFLMGALWLMIAIRQESPAWLSAFAALSCFCVQLTLPTWWSSAIEQSGRFVGTLFGMMNMVGQFGAVASQYFVGWFADRQKDLGLTGRAQWDPMFNIYFWVLILGAVGWGLYHYKPLEKSDSNSH
ncbi:MAG: MFS transporter, partial [Planctomyces sp.]